MTVSSVVEPPRLDDLVHYSRGVEERSPFSSSLVSTFSPYCCSG